MRYIDLTMTYHSGMKGFSFKPAKLMADDGWNASSLLLYSHAGTHMDAPFHFEASQKTIEKYPVSRFFCDCWVVDITDCEKAKLIEIFDLGEIQDKISYGEGLLFRTGWSVYEGREEYRNELPRISKALAEWCADHKISMIGVEPPSVADVNNIAELTEIHSILLGADIVIVEGLCNLEEIKKKKVKLIALPLKIQNGDGAPCRVVAIET